MKFGKILEKIFFWARNKNYDGKYIWLKYKKPLNGSFNDTFLSDLKIPYPWDWVVSISSAQKRFQN